MGFRLNHTSIGPLRLNLSAKNLRQGKNPVTSISAKIGPATVRLWSQNGTRGLSSIDTPGPGSYRFDRRR